MDKILQMLQLQQQLNDATNGENWEKGLTKNNKQIDWKRCAYLECAELIESYPWKHWKNIDAQPNYANIKIEVVDIWHFIMSQALQEYKMHDLGSLSHLSEAIKALPIYASFTQEITPTTKDYYAQIATVEALIKTLFCQEKTEVSIAQFIEVALQSNLNLDALYNLYVGKNILNQFRQDHGYKEGSYVKIWNGQEDNVVMQNILDSDDNLSPKRLYEKLEEALERHFNGTKS